MSPKPEISTVSQKKIIFGSVAYVLQKVSYQHFTSFGLSNIYMTRFKVRLRWIRYRLPRHNRFTHISLDNDAQPVYILVKSFIFRIIIISFSRRVGDINRLDVVSVLCYVMLVRWKNFTSHRNVYIHVWCMQVWEN